MVSSINSNNYDSFNDVLQPYQAVIDKYYKEHPGSNASPLTILSSQGIKLDQVSNTLEDRLEGDNNDGIKGNTISFSRSYYDREKNEFLFQAANGQVLDVNNGAASDILAESDVANRFGVDSNAYDVVDFGYNGIKFKEYAFTGVEDGKPDNLSIKLGDRVSWDYEELDLGTEQGQLEAIKAIGEYAYDHYGLTDLRNVFGYEQGDDQNVTYGDGGLFMNIFQHGREFKLSLAELLGLK